MWAWTRCSRPPASAGSSGSYADGFPSRLLQDERFDVITLLAVLEHVRAADLVAWRDACARLLEPGGLIVATVPSPRVDDILHMLMTLH